MKVTVRFINQGSYERSEWDNDNDQGSDLIVYEIGMNTLN